MLPVHRVIGHKEYGNTPPGGWPGRKGDPVYDMNWRRARVAAFTPRILEDDDVSYDADKANLYATLEMHRNQLAEHINGQIKAAVAATDGKVAALTSVVQQLAAKSGTTIDMAAVEAVVEKGVADAIAGINTTISLKTASD